jgi:hypothetical protein
MSAGPNDRTPVSPFINRRHVLSRPAPSGVTKPMPVTTTLR